MAIYWLEQSESDLPAESHWLSSSEKDQLSRMLFLKRRSDWRLGRWTAKRALAAVLGRHGDLAALANIEVRAAASGAPDVFLNGQPHPLSISLSHRDGVALCTVAEAGWDFGCDLEVVEPRSPSFVADYFTDPEILVMEKANREQREALTTLFWSAKESTLKALRIGLRVDTRDLCVRLSGVNGNQDGESTPIPLSNPSTRLPHWRPLHVLYGDKTFQGWWRRDGLFVRTIVHSPMRGNRRSAA